MDLDSVYSAIRGRTRSKAIEDLHENLRKAKIANDESTARAKREPESVVNTMQDVYRNVQGLKQDTSNKLGSLESGVRRSGKSIVDELRMIRKALSSGGALRIPKLLRKGAEETSVKKASQRSMAGAAATKKAAEPVKKEEAPKPASLKEALATGGVGAAAAYAAKGAIGFTAKKALLPLARMATMTPVGRLVIGGSLAGLYAEKKLNETFEPRKEGEDKVVDKLSRLTRWLGGKAKDKNEEAKEEKARVERIAKQARDREEEARKSAEALGKVYVDSLQGSAKAAISGLEKSALSAQESLQEKLKESLDAATDGKEDTTATVRGGKSTGGKKHKSQAIVAPKLKRIPITPAAAQAAMQALSESGLGGGGGSGGGSGGGGGSSGGAGGVGEAAVATPQSTTFTANPIPAGGPVKNPYGALSNPETEVKPPPTMPYAFGKNIPKTDMPPVEWPKNNRMSLSAVKGTDAATQPEATPDKKEEPKQAQATVNANTAVPPDKPVDAAPKPVPPEPVARVPSPFDLNPETIKPMFTDRPVSKFAQMERMQASVMKAAEQSVSTPVQDRKGMMDAGKAVAVKNPYGALSLPEPAKALSEPKPVFGKQEIPPLPWPQFQRPAAKAEITGDGTAPVTPPTTPYIPGVIQPMVKPDFPDAPTPPPRPAGLGDAAVQQSAPTPPPQEPPIAVSEIPVNTQDVGLRNIQTTDKH